jgi:hypothetical protein
MAASKATAELAVCPGLVDVVVGIVAAGVVTDPFVALIDVRDIGVSGLVTVIALRFSRVGRAVILARATCRESRVAIPTPMLGECRQRGDK